MQVKVKTIFLLLPLLLHAPALLAAPFQVQRILDLNRSVSLNTDKTHTWWVTDREIDPEKHELPVRGTEDRAEPGWKPVKVPGGLIPEHYPRGTRRVWYRKSFLVSSPNDAPRVLRLGSILCEDQTYLNGRLIGQNIKGENRLPSYIKIRMYPIPHNLLRDGAPNTLLVRVDACFADYMGITQDRTELGLVLPMLEDFQQETLIYLLFQAGYFTAGSYFLFLFLRRRRDYEYLAFGVFTYIMVVYLVLRSQLVFQTGLDYYWIKKMEYLALMTGPPIFYYFFRLFWEFPAVRFRLWLDRFALLLTGVSAACFLVIVFTDSNELWNKVNIYVNQSTWIFFVLLGPGGIIAYRLRRKDREALIISLCFLVLAGCTFMDILISRGYLNLPLFSRFGPAFFFAGLALALANRFVNLHNQVEDLNVNLERRVERRTEDLHRSLEEIRELKSRQDGDYFLTSLLLKPLNGNFTHGENVSVELLVRQMKRFTFRKWEEEIGGDLCAAYHIRLRGRDYVAFLNGDAMGKSMQGAGGALVLGTVFKALIARVSNLPREQELWPEQWLKLCFLELQSVFTSFEGSMLISAVVGLADERTGLLYYINAEHPHAVLYRRGRASFIDNQDMALRKIGILDLEGHLRINTFPMRPGDVILLGSDGRDDIALPGQGERRDINKDENLFLRHVEAADGRLKEIETHIRAAGEITDDLSLLRLAYQEGVPLTDTVAFSEEYDRLFARGRSSMAAGRLEEAREAFEEAFRMQPDDVRLHRSLVRLHLLLRSYAKSAEFGLRCLEQLPEETNLIFSVSLSLKKAAEGDGELLQKAAACGERVRLREPDNVKNLVNLGDVYRLLGNFERAAMILDLALARDPHNSGVKRLQKGLMK